MSTANDRSRKRQNFFARKYAKISRKIVGLYRVWVLGNVFPREVRRWFNDKGDETLRLQYDLKPDSVVFDVGGYKGDFAERISSLYGCYAYIFEPSKEFYEICLNRFRGNDKIRCFNFGLSDVDGTFILSDDADGSSVKPDNTNGQGTVVRVRRFSDVIRELDVKKIDLIKINIEGGEYDLLPHIIEEGFVGDIGNIQVQFHTFIKDAKPMRARINKMLERTHKCDWCYVFVWENWSLK
jgi:FkbM family methyltransferase